MFIAVNGDLGSGKSTVARGLAVQLHLPYISTGQIQREIAQSLHLTTLELNRLAERDPSIDEKIDGRLRNLPREMRHAVIDSRMAWMFVPDSVKVRLLAHPTTAVHRILKATDRVSEGYADSVRAHAEVDERRRSERNRFLHTYAVDIEDLTHYSLVVQTDLALPAQVEDAVVQYIHSEPKPDAGTTLLLNPQCVYPTRSVRLLAAEPATAAPIEVAYVDDCFYAIGGHGRLAAAVEARDRFISAVVVAQNAQHISPGRPARQLKEAASPPLLRDWEEALNFRFSLSPETVRGG
jgi:cytidylate kinase